MQRRRLNIFDKAKWLGCITETYDSYCTIYALEKFVRGNKDYIDYSESNDETNNEQLNVLIKHASNQMVIEYCTFIESITKDLFFSIFQEKHVEMCSYLPKEFKDHCSELFKENLSEEATNLFSNIAANKAFSFNIKQTVNNLCKLSNVELSDSIKESTHQIFKLRNSLIHDGVKIDRKIHLFIEKIYTKDIVELLDKYDEVCFALDIKKVASIKEEQETFMRDSTIDGIIGIYNI